MADLLRIGAVAHLDPDAERELRYWREEAERGLVDDPLATRRFLDEHARGEVLVVRLDLFADVLLDDDRVRRYDSVPVPGLHFRRGDAAGNLDHAREMAHLNVDRLRADLDAHGFAVDSGALESTGFVLELDDRLRAAVGGAS
jgi:hypothetical protein